MKNGYSDAMKYIVDTFAWVEYFRGTQKGVKAKRIIDDPKNSLITPECCISELKYWAIKYGEDFNSLYTVVRKISEIEPIFISDWLEAAAIRFEKRKTIKNFGLVDSLIVAKQKTFKCKVLTGDPHFRTILNVKMLE